MRFFLSQKLWSFIFYLVSCHHALHTSTTPMKCQGQFSHLDAGFPHTSSLAAQTRLIFEITSLYTSCTFWVLPANGVKPQPSKEKWEPLEGTWSARHGWALNYLSTVRKGAAEEETGKETSQWGG